MKFKASRLAARSRRGAAPPRAIKLLEKGEGFIVCGFHSVLGGVYYRSNGKQALDVV